jgi:hypothetical protein
MLLFIHLFIYCKMSNSPSFPNTVAVVTNQSPDSDVEVLEATDLTSPKTNSATKLYNPLFSCESCIDKMPMNSNSFQTFKLYWTMCTGLTDVSISTRLETLFANKKFSEVRRKLITPLKLCLSQEVLHRHHYLNLSGREPRTPNWSVNMSTLKLSEPEFALPIQQVRYIKEYIHSFIDTHEEIMKKNKELSKEEGDEISKTDKQRMRLWEAVFADKNHTFLMQMNSLHSKAQMDARNSKENI